jgi:hypothetical protein
LLIVLIKFGIAIFAYCRVNNKHYDSLAQIKLAIKGNESLQIKIYLYLNFLLIATLVAGNIVYFGQDKSITNDCSTKSGRYNQLNSMVFVLICFGYV